MPTGLRRASHSSAWGGRTAAQAAAQAREASAMEYFTIASLVQSGKWERRVLERDGGDLTRRRRERRGSAELMPRRRRGGRGWETWEAGRVRREGDFDAEPRGRGGRGGEAPGESKRVSAETAEVSPQRSAAGATVEVW